MVVWKVLLNLTTIPKYGKVSTRSIGVPYIKTSEYFQIFPREHIINFVIETLIFILFSIQYSAVASSPFCISSSLPNISTVSSAYRRACIFNHNSRSERSVFILISACSSIPEKNSHQITSGREQECKKHNRMVFLKNIFPLLLVNKFIQKITSLV